MAGRSCVIAFILALGGAAVLGSGCANGSVARVHGSGVAKTETRGVGGFHAIRLDGAADVNVTVGQRTEVTVTADDNVLPVIETQVQGGTLVIGNRESYESRVGVRVTIVTPTLDAFELNGSGNVTVKGLSGGTFTAKIRGSGNLTADGTVDGLRASIAGSGDLRLVDLKAKKADVSIAGSGNATVSAEDSFSASVSGSGDVRYKGNPSNVQSNVAGSGSVEKL
jgi:hypothetical protein